MPAASGVLSNTTPDRLGTDGWQIDPPPLPTGGLIEHLFRKHIKTKGDLGENQ
jgi:hypothetical protein